MEYNGSFIILYCILRVGLVMSAGMSFFSLPIVSVVGYAVVLLRSRVPQIKRIVFSKTTLSLLLQILLIIILRTLTINASFISIETVYIRQLLFLLLLLFLYAYIRSCNQKSQKMYVYSYLCCIAVSTVYTLFVAITGTEDIIRNTAFGDYSGLYRFMYGGFDFIYGIVIIYIIILTALHRKRNIRTGTKIVLIVLEVLIALTIVLSAYSTALVLIVIFTAYEIVPGKLVKWIVFAVCYAILIFFPSIVSYIFNAIPFIPKLTSTRLINMVLSMIGRETDIYFSGEGQRFDRIIWTLRVFAENPLLGGFAGDTKLPFGYHTEWLEQMARYGIFSTVLNASYWRGSYRIMKKELTHSDVGWACVRNGFIYFVILGFCDPISMVVTAAPLFILAPFLSNVLSATNYERENW